MIERERERERERRRRASSMKNFSTFLLVSLTHQTTFFMTTLPCSHAFHSPVGSRMFSSSSTTVSNDWSLHRFRLAMVNEGSDSPDDVNNDIAKNDEILSQASTQDIRSFVTQRCIQSFMFLLASTRDLHTVWWLDNFTQPITINNYFWDSDDDTKPVSI